MRFWSNLNASNLEAFKECNWAVAGPHGAAARLGMKRSTLQQRVRKLGIARRSA